MKHLCIRQQSPTDRLYLRRLQTTDAKALFAIKSNPEETRHYGQEPHKSLNEPSKNLLVKLGFKHEGTLRHRVFFRGQYEDQLYFGLLNGGVGEAID